MSEMLGRRHSKLLLGALICAVTAACEEEPRQVVEQVEAQAALEGAAQNLVDAQEVSEKLESQQLDERRKKAEFELVAVEADLAEAISKAENDITVLESSLGRVRELLETHIIFLTVQGFKI